MDKMKINDSYLKNYSCSRNSEYLWSMPWKNKVSIMYKNFSIDEAKL